MATLAAYLDRTDVTTGVGTTPIPGLRTYLGAVATEDAKLKAWYGAAIDWCHAKLSERDFGTGVNPPDSCVIGVYEFVRVMRDYANRPAAGIKRTKTGAREEEYTAPAGGALMEAQRAAWPFIEPFCEDVSLFASGGM